MKVIRILLALSSLSFGVSCMAQPDAPPIDPAEFSSSMNFETQHVGSMPKGWRGGPAKTISVDSDTVHNGRWSARIERIAGSEGSFSTLTRSLPVDFKGQFVTLRGFLRTVDVSEYVGLWMRQDGDSGMVAFDNMQSRQIKDTTDWTEYTVRLPIHAEAKQLFFGFLLGGTGTAWADDLQLLVDDKPVWEAPKAERTLTVIDRDEEFNAGSRIALTELSPVQIDNLALLGKVWGFLKYHHPRVTSGEIHWDYELFRIAPKVLAAADSTAGRAVIREWVTGLGKIEPCGRCAVLAEGEIHLRPRVDWISDQKLLGQELSEDLRLIYRNRPADGKQFYVSLNPNVGNPAFKYEPAYNNLKLPDAGFQLLSVFRFWNIVEYWFPYRDVIGEDWDQVLRQFIPRVVLAKDRITYEREMMALIARVNDTHANLWSSIRVRPPTGDCMLPVNVRFIGAAPVITGYSHPDSGPATGLKAGDVIEALDGVPVAKLVEQWSPYYAASNEPTRLRDIARGITRGACTESSIRVSRESKPMDLKATRVPANGLKISLTHDLPGPAFRKLSSDVAYLKLSSVKIAEAAHYVDSAAGTKGLIIDIRNYPSEFMVFALGSLLVDTRTEFVRFTNGDLSNPGAFHFGKPITLVPATPHYAGKVVILVDETSLSQAEYTSMAFRASPRATVVGSTTAGADGNVSAIPLPGGLRSMISGIGVFYPDKRPTQRVGIVPDVEARPTIAGIREGRDEVLEKALRVILGNEIPDAEIAKLARPD